MLDTYASPAITFVNSGRRFDQLKSYSPRVEVTFDFYKVKQ